MEQINYSDAGKLYMKIPALTSRAESLRAWAQLRLDDRAQAKSWFLERADVRHMPVAQDGHSSPPQALTALTRSEIWSPNTAMPPQAAEHSFAARNQPDVWESSPAVAANPNLYGGPSNPATHVATTPANSDILEERSIAGRHRQGKGAASTSSDELQGADAPAGARSGTPRSRASMLASGNKSTYF